MKKLFLCLLTVFVLFGVSAMAIESTDSIKSKLEKRIQDNYTRTDIQSITINPDAGTKEDDYIALVNLKWNVKNHAQMTKEMLEMYSEDLAAYTYENMPDVQEIAIFWDVPYQEGTAKLSFERKKDGMYYMDKMYYPGFNK